MLRDYHKKYIYVYLEYHDSVHVPSSELGPPEPKRGGGAHSPAGDGVGESQFGRLLCGDNSRLRLCHRVNLVEKISWYIHKTSGFKTSGFKTSGFKPSGFITSETSGLQNVISCLFAGSRFSGPTLCRSIQRLGERETFMISSRTSMSSRQKSGTVFCWMAEWGFFSEKV
jgi:hypothetical protein